MSEKDLVNRLRQAAIVHVFTDRIVDLLEEAADEIEKLSAANDCEVCARYSED